MDPAGDLEAGCISVARPGPGVCRVCKGAAEDRLPLCRSCRRIAIGLERPLLPVLPVSLTKPGCAFYAALRQYKGAPSSITERQQRRLAELIGPWLDLHARCLAPEGFDIVTVVPSLGTRGRQSHPLARTLRMVPMLAQKVSELLTPASAVVALDRNRPDRDVFVCVAESVRRKRVLLVDDIYTTGAHLHSAAAALEDAGARRVSLLVLGRHQRPAKGGSRRILERSLESPWRMDACVCCPGDR